MSASWIFANDLVPASTLYRFSKTLLLPSAAELKLSICADSRYKLYVNGQFAVEGPCHGTRYTRLYETVDLTPYLKEGVNTVYADVLHIFGHEYISVYRESLPALWVDGILTVEGKETPFVSDDTWTAERYTNRVQYSFPGFIPSVPLSEELHGKDTLVEVPLKVNSEIAHPETACFNKFGVREVYPLTPRSLPNLVPAPYEAAVCIKDTPTEKEYDATRYETAFVHVSIKAKAGTRVRVIYAECRTLYDNNGKPYKGLRDDPAGVIEGPNDTLIFTEDGTLTLDTFRYRAFRFIRLSSDAPFETEALTFAPYHYPMGDEGYVTTSDSVFNDMWQVSRHTVMCCAHENYVDCPHYEQQQYHMDSLLQMLFTFRMTGDSRLPRKSIFDLGSSQLPDGMLQANYPSVVVQVIPTFSLFWIMMLREYLRYTTDRAFVKSQLGTMEKVLEAFDNLVDERGLVGTTHYWPFVDWAPEWGDTGVPEGGTKEPLAVHCLQYATALTVAAELCEAFGRVGLAEEYRTKSKQVNAAVNLHFYDANRGLYRNTPSISQYSQQASLWAVLSGAQTGEDARALMERSMTEPISRSTFSMNHFLFRALEQVGLYDTYAPSIFAKWEKMLAEHCTTWCENPDRPRSECHGWSSAPIFELSARVLGVLPTADGFREAEIRPHTALVDSAEGKVPTPYGLVEVAWKKEQGKVTLTVKNPDPASLTLRVYAGAEPTVQTEAEATYTYTA